MRVFHEQTLAMGSSDIIFLDSCKGIPKRSVKKVLTYLKFQIYLYYKLIKVKAESGRYKLKV